MSTKNKLIIDTDVGIDDAWAIAYALRHPDWEIIAFTTCFGNVSEEYASKNVGIICKLLGRNDIPIYRGATRPIAMNRKPPTWFGHGSNGLGDVEFPEHGIKYQTESAATALIKLVNDNPDVYIACIGPLTNIAIATSLDPTFETKIKPGHFLSMGGSHECKGNTTFAAEFNYYQDPEAASVCFERLPSILLVSWEVCASFAIPEDWYEREITKSSAPIPTFLKNITTKYYEEKIGLHICDTYALAVLMNPEFILEKSKKMVGHVELSGTHTRGATVFDWYSKSKNNENVARGGDVIDWSKSQIRPNIEIVLSLNKEEILKKHAEFYRI